ncbi:alpha/beta hydrolase [Cohnella faecalis]|uniref:Esterase n=1 Tax=Cohnella faecalis TaxID=2315694 RepID=A0A398CJ64_9BACL|nr:alpha/beta hydrolase-fold protein [Cohnella faecalis]RIE02360.1 esterase [Cohnella faecalis]
MKRTTAALAAILLLSSTALLQACNSKASESKGAAPTEQASKSNAPETSKASAPEPSKKPAAAPNPLPSYMPENSTLLSKTNSVYRVKFDSAALNKEVRFNIYLPPNYDTAQTYPTLYLLHPLIGSENSVLSATGISASADKLIADGKVNPLIIVAPLLENSYGLNVTDEMAKSCSACTVGNYEDYLTKDLIGFVDGHFSTVKEKSGRYIGGFSAGGWAALYNAFTHPDLFSKVGGHSPYLPLDEWKEIYTTPELKKQRDPLLLAATADIKDLSVYLDSGEQDQYQGYISTEKLNGILQNKKVKSEYHHFPGGHNQEYWDSQSDNLLTFYAGK